MLAVALALALQADEIVLRPPGLDHNVVNPCEVVIDGHVAYLLGRETPALGLLDLKTITLKTVALPAVGRSIHVHPKTGTVYVLHTGSVSTSPRGALKWTTRDVPDG